MVGEGVMKPAAQMDRSPSRDREVAGQGRAPRAKERSFPQLGRERELEKAFFILRKSALGDLGPIRPGVDAENVLNRGRPGRPQISIGQSAGRVEPFFDQSVLLDGEHVAPDVHLVSRTPDHGDPTRFKHGAPPLDPPPDDASSYPTPVTSLHTS